MNSSEIENARAQTRSFGAHYDYDTAYMEEMLEECPEAFTLFSAASPMTSLRSRLPVSAHFVVRLAAMQAADCGPCLEMTIKMAREAGVVDALIRGTLQEGLGLDPEMEKLRAFAVAVTKGEEPDLAGLKSLRLLFGTAGLHEIGVNIAGTLLYPTVKRATGYAKCCALTPLSVQ